MQPGARADLLVVDTQDDALRGLPVERLLDAVVFAAPAAPFRDVMVAGRWVLRNGHHAAGEMLAAAFESAMIQLG